jgi:hypothetical protein
VALRKEASVRKPKVKVVVKAYRSDAIKLSNLVVPFKGLFQKSAEKQMAEDMAKMIADGWRVQSQESVFGGMSGYEVTYVKEEK